jgi:hypothetical protein
VHKVYSWSVGATTVRALGDINGKFYVARDLEIWYFDPGTNAFIDSTKALASVPVGKPVSYHNLMYIPEGENGYQTWDGTTVVAGALSGGAVVKAVDFCTWDFRLVALCIGTTARFLQFWDTATWTAPAGAKLTTTGTAGGIHVRSFYTRSSEPAIAVVSNSGIWMYDLVADSMIPSNVEFPQNSATGLGVCVWKPGENLHISSGMGDYAWSGPGGSISPTGLDRDEGIPIEFTGKIVDFEPGENEMFAMVQVPNRTNYQHGLFAYNGIGWRCIHQHPSPGSSAGWALMSSIGDAQVLFWCWGSWVYWQSIPFGYANPREIVREGILDYEPTGYLMSSWFDANMQEFDKLMSHFYFRQSPDGLTAVSGVDRPHLAVEYQIGDSSSAWVSSGTSWSTIYQHELNFATVRIRFRLTLTKGITLLATPATSIMDDLVLKYIKVPSLYSSFTMAIDLTFEGTWGPPDGSGKPKDALTIKHELDALLAKKSFITFTHEGNDYRGRLSRVSGSDATAFDRRGARNLTFVEVPFSGNTVQAT